MAGIEILTKKRRPALGELGSNRMLSGCSTLLSLLNLQVSYFIQFRF